MNGTGRLLPAAPGPVPSNSTRMVRLIQWTPHRSPSPVPAVQPNTVFNINFTDLTQLNTSSTVSLVSQNGLAAGSLSGFDVATNTGEVYGLYSNGLQQLLGQVAIASFVNPVGLNRIARTCIPPAELR